MTAAWLAGTLAVLTAVATGRWIAWAFRRTVPPGSVAGRSAAWADRFLRSAGARFPRWARWVDSGTARWFLVVAVVGASAGRSLMPRSLANVDRVADDAEWSLHPPAEVTPAWVAKPPDLARSPHPFPPPRSAYSGRLTSDGRYLIVSHPRFKPFGISRFDFATNTWLFIELPMPELYYLSLLEDENLVMLTQMTTSATAYVFWFRLEPFEVLGVDLLAISDLSNGVDGGHGSVAYLSKGAHLGAVTIAPVGPGADPKEFQRVQLDGFVGHLERFRREPGTEFAWVGGEFGTDIVRIDLANRRQDRTLRYGFWAWDLEFDTARNRVYLSKPLMNRVDGLDADTGMLAFRHPVKGFPRALLLDPDGRHLYVGLYSSGLIEVIDLVEDRTLGWLKTGRELRELLWRPSADGGEIVAIASDGFYRIPQNVARDPAAAEGRVLPPGPRFEPLSPFPRHFASREDGECQ